MTNFKYFIVVSICIIFSLICGIISKDIFLGTIIIATGLLSFYFASEGKRVHYLLGFINYILIGYVSLVNHLYGVFFFYIFIFAPLETQGYITWNENIDSDKNIIIKSLAIRKSVVLIFLSFIFSLFLGGLLSYIPGQKLAFLDATSNILNLFGSILMIIQYRESWWVFLLNNMIDLIIWLLVGKSFIMVLTSIGFLVLNILGLIKWYSNSKKTMKLKYFI